jgi:archaellum component FlaC
MEKMTNEEIANQLSYLNRKVESHSKAIDGIVENIKKMHILLEDFNNALKMISDSLINLTRLGEDDG